MAAALLVCSGCTFMTGGGVGDVEGDGPLGPTPEERVPAPDDAEPDPEDPSSDEPDDPYTPDPAPDDPVDPPPDDPTPDEPPDDPQPDGPTSDDPQQLCVDITNEYRAEHGRSALERGAELEECATEGAEVDSRSFFPHAHFTRTGGCGGVADAENECPGWSGDVATVIRECLAMMMDEGPGGGHYENILGDHAAVGCGIFITSRGGVWVVQDFR